VSNIKINPRSDPDILNLLNRYQIWRDWQQVYLNQTRTDIECSKHGIPCFLYHDVDTINQSVAKKIIINNLSESVHSRDYFVQYRPDCEYLILSGGGWDPATYQLPFVHQHLNLNFFLFELSDTYFSPNRLCFYLNKRYHYGHKPLIFISTTGDVRSERDVLLDEIRRNINFDNFSFRYSGDTTGVNLDHLDVVTIKSGEFEGFTPVMPKYYHDIGQTLPIHIYDQAYFNLVVETDIIWQHSFFLTEKTIKSMIVGMPFVIYAVPQFLSRLRDLGFRTYHELWDEGYDHETDLHRRASKIVTLCNQLAHFDWIGHQEQLHDIAQHNRSNFLNLSHIQDQHFAGLEQMLISLDRA